MCGSEAGERFCPVDGTLMVRRQRPDPAALNYTPGHIIDHRYRILGSIGRGGFGAVYAATHTGTGQQVALKVLHVDTGADNQQMIRRFWQEAQITSRLRHANTVRVFDVGQTEEGAFYLAMEHLHGRTLADELDQRPGSVLSEAETAAIGIEICKSLQEAHRAGLVHRDLKPANVMLCETGERSDEAAVAGRWQVKVLDFGIARTADSSLTGQGAALGTPAFMSPEQCRGLDVGPRSDLYSLGVVLFRCVTGRLPFVDENPLAILFHHADTPAPDPRTLASQPVSAALAEGLLKVLSKRADERFADAREMQQALQTVLLATPALAGAAVSDLSGYRAATMLLEAPPAQPPSPARPSAPIAGPLGAPLGDPPAKSTAPAPLSAGSAALAAQRAQTSLAPLKAPAAAAPALEEPAAALQAVMGSGWGWKLMALALAGFAVAAVVLVLMGQEEAPPTQPIAGPVLQAEPGSAPPAQPPVAAPAAVPVAAPAAEPLAAPAAAAPAEAANPATPDKRGDRPAGPGAAQNRATAGESPDPAKAAAPERRDDRPAARGSDRAFELRDDHPPAEKAPDKPTDKSAGEKAQAEKAAADKADRAAAEKAAAEKAAAEKAAAAKPAKPIEKPTALD
jgi:serine/threonine-protein kinase